jgi:hypothetical protein
MNFKYPYRPEAVSALTIRIICKIIQRLSHKYHMKSIIGGAKIKSGITESPALFRKA